MFKPSNQLPFLDNNFNSKDKIERALLSVNGWSYLPFLKRNTVDCNKLSQFKLFVLFGVFGKKIKKIFKEKIKQRRDLKSALDMLKHEVSPLKRPLTNKGGDSKITDTSPWSSPPKRSSSVNFMGQVSVDSIYRADRHDTKSRGGTVVKFLGESPSYSSHRKLEDYCKPEVVRVGSSSGKTLGINNLPEDPQSRVKEKSMELIQTGKNESTDGGTTPVN